MMRRWAIAALALVGASCRVNLSDAQKYTCASDADCGGGGWICVGSPSFCCHPSPEICNGLDDNCDGQIDEGTDQSCYDADAATEGVGVCKGGTRSCVDGALTDCIGEVTPSAEVCNGLDDNCDGTVDDGFDLNTDNQHCGNCATACTAPAVCIAGVCKTGVVETNCADGVDNDNDGQVDCADSDCNGKSCGNGCSCAAGLKAETLCGDGSDNDGDGATDCADSDCDGKACGNGCTCVAGTRTETNCFDGADDDGDGQTDCADSDCASKQCKPSPATFTCDPTAGCACNGVATPPAESGAACTDNADNDCDGLKDCADPDCVGVACGTGCVCKNGGKFETVCNDKLDNDGDGQIDCNDTDCDAQPCVKPNNAAGSCVNKTCK